MRSDEVMVEFLLVLNLVIASKFESESSSEKSSSGGFEVSSSSPGSLSLPRFPSLATLWDLDRVPLPPAAAALAACAALAATFFFSAFRLSLLTFAANFGSSVIFGLVFFGVAEVLELAFDIVVTW